MRFSATATDQPLKAVTLSLLALAAALMLAGCGRSGAPVAPPIEGPSGPVDPAEPDGRQAPERDFVLDPILQ